jgi:hypothetical protein
MDDAPVMPGVRVIAQAPSPQEHPVNPPDKNQFNNVSDPFQPGQRL